MNEEQSKYDLTGAEKQSGLGCGRLYRQGQKEAGVITLVTVSSSANDERVLSVLTNKSAAQKDLAGTIRRRGIPVNEEQSKYDLTGAEKQAALIVDTLLIVGAVVFTALAVAIYRAI